MYDFFMKFLQDTITFNSIVGICLYWLPLFVCVLGYTLRTARNVQKDKRERAEKESSERSFYHPTDTIGDLIGRGFVSIIPVANLWACLFDVSPKLFNKFFCWVAVVFDQPIVPARKDKEK